MSATTEDVLTLRVTLLHGGYSPLPLIGKAPALKEWQKRNDTSEGDIQVWSKVYPAAGNTGILTRLTPALDLDLLNADAAAAAEDFVRERYEEAGYVLTRIGRAPKRAILFRTQEPFAKILINLVAPNGGTEKIEFLADGQQLACFGIHPETNRPYSWHKNAPGEIAQEELPYIREAEARVLVDELVEMLVADFGYARAPERSRRKKNGPNDAGKAYDGPADWQYLVDRIRAGEALHDSLRDLAAKLVTSGMVAGAVVNLLQALMESSEAPRDERWLDRLNEIPCLVDSAEKFRGDPADTPAGDAGAQPNGLGEWDAGDDTLPPPPRGWLLGTSFARKFLSSILGDGAVGKSALRYAQALSLASGKPLTGEHVFQRGRVLIVSLEDDADELRRRILAACLHFGITREEIVGWLFLAAPGAAAGKLMTTDRRGNTIRGALASHLDGVIAARKIDLVMLDPFVKAHSVEENLNSAIDDVAQLLTDIAARHNIAVDAPHHTSKGASDPGNAQRGRGASALVNACRLVTTISQMSEDEAATFNIAAKDRRQYVRIDPGKINIAPSAGAATWFRLVDVALDNPNDVYLNGDHVQTVEPWQPPETWAYLTHDMLNQMLTAIDAGTGDGNFYTDAAKAPGREAWTVIRRFAPGKSEEQCRIIIKTWVTNGVLVPFQYENPMTRKNVRGLKVDPLKRPS